MSLRPLVAIISLTLLSAACGPSGPSPEEIKKQEAAEAKKKADEKSLADRKAKREAEQKAKEDAEKAEKAAIDALAVLPETMPKKLDKACAARAQAEDDFMNKHYEGEAVEKWNKAKGTQLGFAKQSCLKAGSLEVPACQIEALNNAPTELRKKLPDLLRACMDKFGKEGSAAPPRR
ncbi:MAG TPA: hypothetical protein ENJ18_13875 [Nannocystis exedens]|nr:hypothetical protein [Nannocystis exedens]